jgi:hypothetical protein
MAEHHTELLFGQESSRFAEFLAAAQVNTAFEHRGVDLLMMFCLRRNHQYLLGAEHVLTPVFSQDDWSPGFT